MTDSPGMFLFLYDLRDFEITTAAAAEITTAAIMYAVTSPVLELVLVERALVVEGVLSEPEDLVVFLEPEPPLLALVTAAVVICEAASLKRTSRGPTLGSENQVLVSSPMRSTEPVPVSLESFAKETSLSLLTS